MSVELIHIEVVYVLAGPILVHSVGDYEVNVPFRVGLRLYPVDDPLDEGEFLKYTFSGLFELLFQAGEVELWKRELMGLLQEQAGEYDKDEHQSRGSHNKYYWMRIS